MVSKHDIVRTPAASDEVDPSASRRARIAPLPIAAALLLAQPLAVLAADATATATDAPAAEAKPVAGKATAAQAGETVLPTVRVRETHERAAIGYQGTVTRVGKTAEALRDIPNSVTVITEQLIVDRNVDSLKEALRNVAGLTINAGEGGRIGDNITIRGYSVVGDLYLDGMRDTAQYNREVFNVEQVDVLRGSASMLFGRGSTGGIVNQVSKQAGLFDRNEAVLTVGNHDYKRVTADFNKAIGDNAAFRVNLMDTQADSARGAEGVTLSRRGIAPTLRFGAGTSDEFTLSHFQLKEHNVPDYGVPYGRAVNGRSRPLGVPVSTFYGLANADYERNDTDISTAVWKHRFSRDTELRTTIRHAEYERNLWATAPRIATATGAITGATLLNRQRQARGSGERIDTVQSDLVHRTVALGMYHQLIAGVEHVNEEAVRWSNTNSNSAAAGSTNPQTTAGFPDPFVTLPAAYYSTRGRAGFASYTANTKSVYAQDIVEFAPQWKALVGVRQDTLAAGYRAESVTNAQSNVGSRVDYQVASWRTGLVWQPSEQASYYASWGTAFNPSAEAYQIENQTGVPNAGSLGQIKEELNRNTELGAKWDLADGNLSIRTALYHAVKLNERNTDLASTSLALTSRKRHTDGVELEVAGRITPQWEVFAGASLMHAKVDLGGLSYNATTNTWGPGGSNAGTRPINTPHHTASIWSTYALGEGWKVGGGVEHVGQRFGNGQNTAVVPGTTRVDTMVTYEQKAYTLRLNVFNLLDRVNYEGVYAGHVVPGATRTVQLSAALRF